MDGWMDGMGLSTQGPGLEFLPQNNLNGTCKRYILSISSHTWSSVSLRVQW